MECGSSPEEKAEFLIYCFNHAVIHGLPFAGKTLKVLHDLGAEAVPDYLEDDRVYPFFSTSTITELVEKAQKRLKQTQEPGLGLVKNG